jgi:hypothetical protein
MLQKAYDAHRYFQEQGKPAPTEDQGVDELLYIGGIKQQGPTTPNESQSQTTPPMNAPTHPQFRASSPFSAPAPDIISPKSIYTPFPSLSMPLTPTARPQRSDSDVPLTYAGKPQPEAITPLTYSAISPLASSAPMTYPVKALSDPTQYTSPARRIPDMLSNLTFAAQQRSPAGIEPFILDDR